MHGTRFKQAYNFFQTFVDPKNEEPQHASHPPFEGSPPGPPVLDFNADSIIYQFVLSSTFFHVLSSLSPIPILCLFFLTNDIDDSEERITSSPSMHEPQSVYPTKPLFFSSLLPHQTIVLIFV